ncbi:unannotated protein [freshwater metagenome]|uniref:Unannotated protein n=1 Tax=freshwater metagenome TaxID=449393 RepID=A0A6J6Z9S4_9ZZZZ
MGNPTLPRNGYRSPMRKLLAVGVTAIALFSLTSCSRSSTDFAKAAEKAIGGADTARVIGQEFTGIYCEDPGSTSKGVTFSCAGQGKTDGKRYKFTATITSSSRVEITDYKAVE